LEEKEMSPKKMKEMEAEDSEKRLLEMIQQEESQKAERRRVGYYNRYNA